MTGQELLAVLDEELLALPESLRAPLVLCYLEGATRDEAAERLGCPLSTLKKRLERGRDRLHAALVRRGLGLSAALLGTLLAGSASAVPLVFISKTIHAAAALAAGNTAKGMISTQVSQLLNGGISMTGGSKIKATLVVLLLGGMLTAAGAAAYSTRDDKPKPQTAAAASETKAEPPAEQTRSLRVVVLDPQGKPLPGANVHASVWTNEPGFKANRDIETDAKGVAHVELPKTYYIVRLWAWKKPFVSMWAGWEQGELSSGKNLPGEYTFHLEKAVTAGGRVLDEKGKPIAGAKVEVRLANDPKPIGSDGRVLYSGSLANGEDAATTDADGRWKISNVPDHREVELYLLVTHPDYITDERWNAKTAGVTTKMFREGTATVTLKSGVIVRGRVTGPDGKPIKDAIVIHGVGRLGEFATSKFATDAEGRFRLPALPAGLRSLTVIAPGFAPQMRDVELKRDMPEQDFAMAAGKPVRLRIVDAAGKPIPKAYVSPREWKGSRSIYSVHNTNHPKVPDTGIPRQADAEGVWSWPSAPDDPVKVQIYAPGFASLEMEVTGGSTDRTVTLKAEHKITGTVTDAVTGKPIPAFTVIPVNVFGKDWLSADRGHAVAGKNGRLEYPRRPHRHPAASCESRHRATALRTGRSSASATIRRKQDFRLQPSQPRIGRVVDAAGKPVPKATVLLATPTEVVWDAEYDTNRVFTDEAGRFAFPDPGEPWAIVAKSDAGYRHRRVPGRQDRRRHPDAAARGVDPRPVPGRWQADRRCQAVRQTDSRRYPQPAADPRRLAGGHRRQRPLRVPAGAARPGQRPGLPGAVGGPGLPVRPERAARPQARGEGRAEPRLRRRDPDREGEADGQGAGRPDCTYSLNYLIRRGAGRHASAGGRRGGVRHHEGVARCLGRDARGPCLPEHPPELVREAGGRRHIPHQRGAARGVRPGGRGVRQARGVPDRPAGAHGRARDGNCGGRGSP